MSEFVNTASRRSLLIAGAATATFLAALPATRLVARPISTPSLETSKGNNMSYLTMKDGTQIFYKDWGTGQPIVFHHGWPLSGDDWDNQMLFFLAKGYRVIAHDRRGHGRSRQTDRGNDMDTYAADMAELAEALDLKDAIHVGHSTGGGEVTRYVARHGKGRVAKAVLISAIPPVMVKSERTPGVRRSRCSTGIARHSRPTGRSSTSISRAVRSTASTDRARRSRRA